LFEQILASTFIAINSVPPNKSIYLSIYLRTFVDKVYIYFSGPSLRYLVVIKPR